MNTYFIVRPCHREFFVFSKIHEYDILFFDKLQRIKKWLSRNSCNANVKRICVTQTIFQSDSFNFINALWVFKKYVTPCKRTWNVTTQITDAEQIHDSTAYYSLRTKVSGIENSASPGPSHFCRPSVYCRFNETIWVAPTAPCAASLLYQQNSVSPSP